MFYRIKRRKLETALLKVLAAHGPLFVSDIKAELKERGDEPSLGALLSTLTRLETLDMVTRVQKSAPTGTGQAGHYDISPRGRRRSEGQAFWQRSRYGKRAKSL